MTRYDLMAAREVDRLVAREVDRLAAAGFGFGALGPWDDRTRIARRLARDAPITTFRARVVAAHVNQTYSVQRAQHPAHRGIDHLVIRLHYQDEVTATWSDLQAIKDALGGAHASERFALEVYPPAARVIANYPLRHLWVMPPDWTPPIDLADGNVPV